MIQWLNEWLKEIIIIILFAAFIDLILPNNTTRRYVKVVVSLFILMTILSPLLRWLEADFDFDEIYRSITSQAVAGDNPQVERLDVILDNARKLSENNQQLSLQTTKAQVEQAMETELEGIFQLQIERIEVALTRSPVTHSEQTETATWAVAAAVIYVGDQTTTEAGQASAIAEIMPVDIDIQIDSVGNDERVSARIENVSVSDYTVQQTEQAQQIEAYLEERWQLQQKQIEVLFIESVG